jgi:DNA-directed RNA polymerase specialized sigma24 family protein
MTAGGDPWPNDVSRSIRWVVRKDPSELVPRRSGLSVESEFTTYVRADLPRVVAFLIAAGFGAQEAEDAAAEAMTRAFRNWATIEHPAAWVRKAAFRTAVQNGRRCHEETRRAVAGGWLCGVDNRDRYDEIDGNERLVRWLSQLPPGQRAVLALDLDGLDDEQIAAVLGVRRSTVRSHRRYAHVSLKKVIEHEQAQAHG